MVAIKDMEMPKSCLDCDFFEGENTYCDGDVLIPYGFFDDGRENKRHPDCPLVEIITCKDCDNWDKRRYLGKACYCRMRMIHTDPNEFCNEAMRK